MNKENIKLSIIVPVYNHEKYIKECISSILFQKCTYSFEVLIGEDCSTDNSRKILKEMEETLPSNFYIFYREKNLGMGDSGNTADLLSRAKGEYIITIEGDDFWLYDNKIQKQIEFLDNNPEYIACSHHCLVVDENSNLLDELYPTTNKMDFSFKEYSNGKLPGQTATIMYRQKYINYSKEFSPYILYKKFPGDQKRAFLLLHYGKVKCFQENWSAYRHVTTSGTSFSALHKYTLEDQKNEKLYYESIYNFSKSKGNNPAIIASGKLYFNSYFRKSVGKSAIYQLSNFLKEIIKEKNMLNYCIFIIYFELNHLLNKLKK